MTHTIKTGTGLTYRRKRRLGQGMSFKGALRKTQNAVTNIT